jgi:hypothetical protein
MTDFTFGVAEDVATDVRIAPPNARAIVLPPPPISV